MKPPDFLWETKIPSQLKRLVNMARLENATYDEVVTHSEWSSTDLRKVTTFQAQQWPQAQQQHVQATVSFVWQRPRNNLQLSQETRTHQRILNCKNFKQKEESKRNVGQYSRK